MSELTISWPGQCCAESCIEDIGVHNVQRHEAETIVAAVRRVAPLLAAADVLADELAELRLAAEADAAWPKGWRDFHWTTRFDAGGPNP